MEDRYLVRVLKEFCKVDQDIVKIRLNETGKKLDKLFLSGIWRFYHVGHVWIVFEDDKCV